ncbi:MAG TPA: two-component regulator propeller domain-containing protein, partial [Flavisolibacter sp.]|nr:two-component regulator propeller domain-containing protein [Flavisolibacter sp.]
MLRLLTLLLFACLNYLTVAGQKKHFQFSHLDISRGLSNNQVTSIIKDPKGFLLVGTGSGLNRYDGYQFKTFTNSAKDTTSISGDFIINLKECPAGKICIQTRSGANIYDPATEKFDRNWSNYLRKLGMPPGSNITDIVKDKEGNFLFLSDSLLYKYTTATGKTSVLYNSANLTNAITAISIDNNNQYWLIHNNSILRKIDAKTGKIIAQTNELTKIFGKAAFYYQLFVDNDNELWIYSAGNTIGLARYNPLSGTIIHYEKNSGYLRLNTDLVNNVQQDNNGNIWICTDHGGVNLLNKKENKIQYLVNSVDDEKSLSDNSILSIYKDNEGIIWLGTFKKGINYYHENITTFPVYRHQPSNPNSLSFDDVNRFVEDAKGNLWIGTNGGGLIYFDRTNNKFTQYLHQPGNKNSISNNIIVSLLLDRKQRLWIGSYFGGLDYLENGKFTNYRNNPANPSSLSDDRVWDIFEDSKNNLWIGTFNGLNKLDEKRGVFHHYNTRSSHPLHSDFVGEIIEDRQGNLWLGTYNGIDVLYLPTGAVKHFDNYTADPHGLSNNNISELYQDSRGLIWVGTVNGLCVYNRVKDNFQSFYKEDGLPDKAILNIVEDNDGRLWVSTKKGISQISVKQTNNPDAPVAIACTNFDEADGLQGAEFNEKAALKTSKGEIIFGGPNGFNLFNPADILPQRSTPNLAFTDLQLFNKSVGVGEKIEGRVVLPQSISNTSSITLRYNENILAIEFAALNFFNSEKIKYAYKLDGFNKDWVIIDGEMRKAIYTNLDPGNYTFRVKASYANGDWSDKELTLKIRIRPPFWRTPVAYLLYALVLVISLLIARKITVERTRMRFEVEHQRKEAERVQALDAMKTKFFTNVSHEFRTPLTLILSPLEKIIGQTPNEEQKQQLNLVQRNAKRLLNLVNQLLDFRKIEVQEMKLHPAIGDIVAFSQDICHSFMDIADKKNIRFAFSPNIDHLEIYFDKDKLEKILFNLLSNAFKYTHNGGDVQVVMTYSQSTNNEGDGTLAIEVKDTGIGIPSDQQQKIFERFFQTDVPESMVNQGTGIGLAITKEFVKLHNGVITVKSEPEKGTCFTVLLPAKKFYDPSIRPVGNTLPAEEGEPIIFEESQKSGKKKTILIVEDNEDLRFYLKDNLKRQYQVEEAANGKEGWEKTKLLNPDLIVSDIMMPLMDGVEMARKIKNEMLTAHIPIILLSAMGSEEKQLEGLNVGVNDYITKPFTFEILASKIRNLVAQQKLLQKKFQTQIEVNPSEVTVTPVDEKFLKQALEIVEKHIDEPEFSVEDFSREMFMNRVTLYRKILSITGKTPLEFIRSIRLKRAAQLLEKSGMTIAEIAYEVGFNNPKNFSKFFKEEFHVTPSQY